MKYFNLLLLLPLLALVACDSAEEESNDPITIEELVVGTGAMAEEGYFVSFAYTGALTDGTPVFASDTLQLALGDRSVIPGVEQGLLGMREGGKRRVTVPPNLAFGRAGQGNVPPNSTLVFELEVLKVGESNGILIEQIVAGTGAEATRGSMADVSYKGTLLNGKVFDQGDYTLRIDGGGVIEGFNRGVRGMKVGGTRRVTIPPSLGYGGRPTGSIPAFSTLVFEITLNEVRQ